MNKILRYSFVALMAMMFGNVMADVTDELTLSTFGVSGTSYTGKSGITATSSAVYAGSLAGGNSSIQLRSTNSSGIVTTASGGTVKSVKIEWNSNTTAARVLDVYGSTTAYESAADLYNNDKKGEKIASFKKEDGDKTTTIDGSYQFIGFRSNSGAMYISKITIVWEGTADTRAETTMEFAAGYQTRFTYGANGESVALATPIIKAGDTPINTTAVTWQLTKDKNFVVGDAEPVIEGNVVKPSNQSYGKLTLTANFEGDANNKACSNSYTLTVYKGYMTLGGIFDDFFKEGSKFNSTGIPVSYWCMANETTASTATVTYVNGKHTYISDGTNSLLLYDNNSNLGLVKGDVISCDKGNNQGFDAIYGTMKSYNGLPQFATSADDMNFTVKSQGAEVTPKTITPAGLSENSNLNAYLKIENAEYVSADNKNLTFKVGETSFIVRQNWTNVSIESLEPTAKYTLEGMGAVYVTTSDETTTTTYQLYLISFTKTAEASVNAIKTNGQFQGKMYNTAGQVVNKGYKGLVIQDGRKFVNK